MVLFLWRTLTKTISNRLFSGVSKHLSQASSEGRKGGSSTSIWGAAAYREGPFSKEKEIHSQSKDLNAGFALFTLNSANVTGTLC